MNQQDQDVVQELRLPLRDLGVAGRAGWGGGVRSCTVAGPPLPASQNAKQADPLRVKER